MNPKETYPLSSISNSLHSTSLKDPTTTTTNNQPPLNSSTSIPSISNDIPNPLRYQGLSTAQAKVKLLHILQTELTKAIQSQKKFARSSCK
ncbi:hypothetical protein HMI55_003607 [Coelomomyces lativittatus]|nr:hypothetical protein HMI55_003607 [Coelomomyces lativittatus]KAJ1501927.1 hypothetical protein HMI56_002963 [Coelomomyces lativittatus]